MKLLRLVDQEEEVSHRMVSSTLLVVLLSFQGSLDRRVAGKRSATASSSDDIPAKERKTVMPVRGAILREGEEDLPVRLRRLCRRSFRGRRKLQWQKGRNGLIR